MDDKKQYEPIFPQKLDFLNEQYEKFQQALDSIDYQLDNSLEDKGPNPAPSPPGQRLITPELRQKRIEYLERTRERRVTGFKIAVQKEIGGLDAKLQQTINSRLDFQTSRNSFRNYSKLDLTAVKSVSKVDEIAFDYMSANHFNKHQIQDKPVAHEKENIDAWGARYQNQIDYVRNKDGKDVMGLIEEPEPEKD